MTPEQTLAPFAISRGFDAPRALVWRAFADPERMRGWWGPKGFVVTVSKMDLRPTGVYHYCLRGPDGGEIWGRFVYREITPPERLVWVNSFSDPEGGLARHPFDEDWPLQMLTTVAFAETGGRTTVTVTWAPMEATDAERRTFDTGRGSMTEGWTGTFDKLAAYLAAGQGVYS